jgi:4-hydroxy-tetrahydrodipicolinate synthase
MIAATSLRGIWSAVLTPVDERFEPDAPRAVAYYRDLLADGIDGINLLGTTGEAMSFSATQRLRLMEAVAASVPHDRIMCGTGASALADAAQLTQAASELGFCAALIMPPFFYRDATGGGILRFFDALFSRTGSLRCTVVLYNFPRMSGITFSADLIDRLNTEFPGTIGGMKDSSNDRELQRELLARNPSFRISAGCISGTVCLWPRLANDAFTTGDAALGTQVRDLRDSLTGAPLIAVVRARVATARKDDTWLRTMPPNT